MRREADRDRDAQRRQEIVRYFTEHGGTKTARHFGIDRSRVYQIVNHMLQPDGYYKRTQAHKLKNYIAKRKDGVQA